MDRIFFGVFAVVGVIGLRTIFVTDPAVGALITYVTALVFVVMGGRYALNCTPPAPVADPNQGFDPRTVEAARRRADGIE